MGNEPFENTVGKGEIGLICYLLFLATLICYLELLSIWTIKNILLCGKELKAKLVETKVNNTGVKMHLNVNYMI